MFNTLPSDDVLYEALVTRDERFEGRAYVGVVTTGIFCRFSCSGRKPQRANCLFFSSVSECIAAGFRPCLRCRPLQPLGQAEPIVAHLLSALAEEPGRRWLESDVIRLGFDPSTVRRQFKRHVGVTFLDLARMYRMKSAGQALASGASVIHAQLEASFESASGFRAAFSRVLGRSPSAATADTILFADWMNSPIGPMVLVVDRTCVHVVEFFDRRALRTELRRLEERARTAIGLGRTDVTDRIQTELASYFRGDHVKFETPLAIGAPSFTSDVWSALQCIPIGETRSYGELAVQLGRAASARAVARACGANKIGIVVPCHRVIGIGGDLTGYGGGIWRKRWLLDHEATIARASRAPVTTFASLATPQRHGKR